MPRGPNEAHKVYYFNSIIHSDCNKGLNVCLYSLHLFQLSLFCIYTTPGLLKENIIDVITLLLFTYGEGKKKKTTTIARYINHLLQCLCRN